MPAHRDQAAQPDPSEGRWSEVRLPLLLQAGAGFAGLAYGCGLVVMLLHHARYGVYEMDLLRPRVFFAGFVFLLLVGVGTWMLLRSFGREVFRPDWTGNPWALLASRVPDFLLLVVLATFPLGLLLLGESWKWPVAAATMAAMFLTVPIAILGSRRTPRLVLAFEWLLSLVVVFLAVRLGSAPLLALAGWFAFLGISVVGWQVDLWRREEPLTSLPIPNLLLALSTLLTLYAVGVYGHMRPQWGGGALRPVTLSLAAPQAFFSSLTPNVFLLEETTGGYYVLESASDKVAFFIPRAEIKGVRYDESPDANIATTEPAPASP